MNPCCFLDIFSHVWHSMHIMQHTARLGDAAGAATTFTQTHLRRLVSTRSHGFSAGAAALLFLLYALRRNAGIRRHHETTHYQGHERRGKGYDISTICKISHTH